MVDQALTNQIVGQLLDSAEKAIAAARALLHVGEPAAVNESPPAPRRSHHKKPEPPAPHPPAFAATESDEAPEPAAPGPSPFDSLARALEAPLPANGHDTASANANGRRVAVDGNVVSYGGKSAVLTLTEAIIVAELVKVMPSLLSHTILGATAFPGAKKDSRAVMAAQVTSALADKLPQIGLKVARIRNIGVGLSPLA